MVSQVRLLLCLVPKGWMDARVTFSVISARSYPGPYALTDMPSNLVERQSMVVHYIAMQYVGWGSSAIHQRQKSHQHTLIREWIALSSRHKSRVIDVASIVDVVCCPLLV